MTSLAQAVVFLCACATAKSLPFVDLCPDMKHQEEFDMNRFQGRWYELYRISAQNILTTKCHTETYTLDPEKGQLDAVANFVEIATGRNLTTEGFYKYLATSPGVMPFFFPAVFAIGKVTVLETDYDNYAVLFSCQPVEIVPFEFVWVLSRTTTLPKDILEKLMKQKKYLKLFGPVYDVEIDQKHC